MMQFINVIQSLQATDTSDNKPAVFATLDTSPVLHSNALV
jgi:hypothetical protein